MKKKMKFDEIATIKKVDKKYIKVLIRKEMDYSHLEQDIAADIILMPKDTYFKVIKNKRDKNFKDMSAEDVTKMKANKKYSVKEIK